MKKLTSCISLLFLLGFSITCLAQPVEPGPDQEDDVGFLRLRVVDMDSVYVVLNDDFENIIKFASGDSLSLPTGPVKVRIMKRHYRDQIANYEIREGRTIGLNADLIPTRNQRALYEYSSYPRMFWGHNNFILSDPGTELYVNGEYVGTHYAGVNIDGKFEVKGIHSSGVTFTRTFTTSENKQFNFHRRHIQPSRTTSRVLGVIPGGSQFYKGQNLKAVAFMAGIFGGAALAYSYDNQYRQSMDEYNLLLDQYRAADNISDAYRLGNELNRVQDNSVSLSRTRNWLVYGTALLYLVNFGDSFLAPSIGFRNTNRMINPYLDFNPIHQQAVLGIKTSF